MSTKNEKNTISEKSAIATNIKPKSNDGEFKLYVFITFFNAFSFININLIVILAAQSQPNPILITVAPKPTADKNAPSTSAQADADSQIFDESLLNTFEYLTEDNVLLHQIGVLDKSDAQVNRIIDNKLDDFKKVMVDLVKTTMEENFQKFTATFNKVYKPKQQVASAGESSDEVLSVKQTVIKTAEELNQFENDLQSQDCVRKYVSCYRL